MATVYQTNQSDYWFARYFDGTGSAGAGPDAARAVRSCGAGGSGLGKTQHHSGAAPVYPKELLACDGRLVVLSGFAAPYDNAESGKSMTGVRQQRDGTNKSLK